MPRNNNNGGSPTIGNFPVDSNGNPITGFGNIPVDPNQRPVGKTTRGVDDSINDSTQHAKDINRNRFDYDLFSKLGNGSIGYLTGDVNPIEQLEYILQNSTFTSPDQFDAYLNNYLQLLIRDEDFKRSSPDAQLARLMGVGMSRSAALQALQQVNYGQTSPGIAGNVAQGQSDALNGLVNTGMSLFNVAKGITSIIQSMPLYRMNQHLLTRYPDLVSAQINGYNAAARVHNNAANLTDYEIAAQQDYGLLQQCLYNYREDHPDFQMPQSWHDLSKFIATMDIGDTDWTGMALKGWYDRFASEGITNPLAYGLIRNAYNEDYYQSWLNSYSKRQADANDALNSLNMEQTSYSIYESISRTLNNIKNGEYTDKQKEYLAKQCLLTMKECNLIDANTYLTYSREYNTFLDSLIKEENLDVMISQSPAKILEAQQFYSTLSQLPIETFKNRAQKMFVESNLGFTTALINMSLADEQLNVINNDSHIKLRFALQRLGLSPAQSIGASYGDAYGVTKDIRKTFTPDAVSNFFDSFSPSSPTAPKLSDLYME